MKQPMRKGANAPTKPPVKDRKGNRAPVEPPTEALLPPNLPKAERVDRENDLA